MGFIHLHIHSEYSLLTGVCRIDELVAEAKKQQFRAIALTDRNVLYGVVPFYQACKKEHIQPIIGMELHLIEQTEKQLKINEVLLLAKNEQGYQNLLKLSTEANMEIFRVQGIDKETLFRYTEGLILILNFAHSDVVAQILQENESVADQLLRQYESYFEHVYIEIQAHSKEELLHVQKVANFAKKYKYDLVATNHVHFLHQEHHLAYQVVNAVRHGEPLDEVDRKTSHYYLKTEQEMVQIFQDYKEALINTEKIAELCHVELELGRQLLPKYPVPTDDDAHTYLRKICEKGLYERYELVDETMKNRLDYELSVIAKMNFSDYFLIVWDFMKYAHERKMITGPGRGSAAGSLVAYVLRITNVDPIRYHLLFERFLNPERVTMPDIDIDFPDHRREEVIDYVKQKYGTSHVAQIITFGTFAAKAAIRDVGRVLNTDTKLIDRMAKLIPSSPGVKLVDALIESKELNDLVTTDEEAKRIFTLAKMIEGLPRHTSTHAAGIVISDEPLTNYIPLEGGHSQFPMEVLEEIGLLKMDFLGLRNLTLIEQIVANINRYEDKSFHIDAIDENDVKTFQLLSKGETTGVFQLESEGMKRVLMHLKPSEFEDIVAVNALYRPGPMEFIPHFIDRKHGKKKVTYPHPSLEPILKGTYGVIVYQEQIMQIAAKMARFTLGEADLLRRAVSKKDKQILEKERSHFVQGAIANGYKEEEATAVYDMIVKFANYGFNRSHAVAYSMISYQLAFLKANYPLAFYAALLSSVLFHQEKLQQYIAEAKKLNIRILPPSINASMADFSIENDAIRFGLMPIRYLGQRASEEIINERKNGPYKNIFDFCKRVNLKLLTRRGIESLILAGCFDEMNDNRAELLANLDEAITLGEIEKNEGESLFQGQIEDFRYHEVPPFDEREKLAFEKEVLGFYFSSHPIETFQEVLARYQRKKSVEVGKYVHQTVYLAGLIEKVKRIKTKKGDSMAFVLISDEFGEIEAIVFPDQYRKFYPKIVEGELVLLQTKIDLKGNTFSIIIQNIDLLKEIEHKNTKKRIFLRIESKYENHVFLEKIKQTLLSYPGENDVYLYFAREKKTLLLSEKYCIDGSDSCILHLQKILGANNVAIKEGR